MSKAVESAQKRVEGNNFDARKRLLQYDDVLRQQREIIYKERYEVIETENMRVLVESMIAQSIDNVVGLYTQGEQNDWNLKAIEDYVAANLLEEGAVKVADLQGKPVEGITKVISDAVHKRYE